MTLTASARLQRMLPQRLLCRIVYTASRSRARWLKRPLIAWFRDRYEIDLSDALLADPESYATFNDFFTRGLKPGARSMPEEPDAVVAPCDGTLTEFGTLDGGRMLQAKGMSYSVAALLGETAAGAAAFHGGRYATIYLAPRDYHRVHLPVAGALTRTRYLPGDRFCVNVATASSIAGLFVRNERVVQWFDGVCGPIVLVMVGALNVSSISTARHGEIASGPAREWREDTPAPFAKGAEVGRFNLGSTVIFLAPPDAVRFEPRLAAGQIVRMGMPIARVATGAP